MVSRLAGTAPSGDHFVRFAAEASGSSVISQESWAPDGADSAELRLWARGGGPGTGLRIVVRSVLDLGSGPVRAPILNERVPVDDPDWDLVAFVLPTGPNGITTIELSTYGDGENFGAIDLDDVRLAVCR